MGQTHTVHKPVSALVAHGGDGFLRRTVLEALIIHIDRACAVIVVRKPVILRYNATTKELWAAGPGAFKLAR